jgi:hypothetical protein
MFEGSTEMKDSSRPRLAAIAAAITLALALGGGAYYWLASRSAETARVDLGAGMLRAGTPEFDAYLAEQKAAIVNLKRLESENMVGFRYDIACEVKNAGPRPLTGIEMRAYIIDFDRKVIAERIVYPMQARKLPVLATGESVPVRAIVDGIKDGGQVMDVLIEIRGLRFGS